MAQGIFLIQSDNSLVELKEQPYDTEDLLQELLARYPHLLREDQDASEKPQRFLLIKREMGIPFAQDSADRWSLDHLFIDSNAVPTLVEVKRATDTRARREVVAQMLDYAANAVIRWPVERIQSEFEANALKMKQDANILLQEFLNEEMTLDDFWTAVKSNLQIGKIRLIFVSDEIPMELRRIVEFLNKQMDPAEVIAIEVKQFVGQGIRSLVPHVIGQTIESVNRKSKGQWNEETFFKKLAERSDHREYEISRQIYNWAASRDLRIAWGSGAFDASFFPMLDWEGENIYTFGLWTGAKKNAYIQLQFAQYKRNFKDLEHRQELAKRLMAATGVPIDPKSLNKYPSIKLMQLNEKKLAAFLDVFDWYLDQIKAPLPEGKESNSA